MLVAHQPANPPKQSEKVSAYAAGRFAPSPSGPLHLGSLYTAVASYLDAKAKGIPWRLRLDDLDGPRIDPKAESRIVHTLKVHGLHWDGPAQRQSEHLHRYAAALAKLHETALTFYCTCSRKALAAAPRYPGLCRHRRTPVTQAAVRICVQDAAITFIDGVLGVQHWRLGRTLGDFIIKRRDGPFAYQLATAVDDGDPGISRVLRGGDLLEDTPKQLYLMRLLKLPAPAYVHIPVLVNDAGRKWSKQTGAPPVDDRTPRDNIRTCLRLLGLRAPKLPLDALLRWAAPRWRARRISRENLRVDLAAPIPPDER